MLEAISNTSPLLYLYRIGKIELLPHLTLSTRAQRGQQNALNLAGRDDGLRQGDSEFTTASLTFEWSGLYLAAK